MGVSFLYISTFVLLILYIYLPILFLIKKDIAKFLSHKQTKLKKRVKK